MLLRAAQRVKRRFIWTFCDHGVSRHVDSRSIELTPACNTTLSVRSMCSHHHLGDTCASSHRVGDSGATVLCGNAVPAQVPVACVESNIGRPPADAAAEVLPRHACEVGVTVDTLPTRLRQWTSLNNLLMTPRFHGLRGQGGAHEIHSTSFNSRELINSFSRRV